MDFLKILYGFRMVLLCFPIVFMGFLMISYSFRMEILGYPLWISH